MPAELGKLPADQIVSALPRTTWFSAVGTPLDASERAACRRYLRGLGAESCSIETVPSWYEAIERARKTSWWTTWWERERAEERALFAQAAAAARSTEAVVLRLANLMQGSASLFLSPAHLACARAGIHDDALANAAAGAAAQSLHQYGLAAIAGREDHPFAAKFRLFLAGRWPLSIGADAFYIF